VFALYDDAFYQASPAAKWRDVYGRIRGTLGKSHTHTLTNWTVNSVAGTAGTGQHVTLVYRVDYDAGPGTETIGVFIPATTGQAGIRSHHFNADALVPYKHFQTSILPIALTPSLSSGQRPQNRFERSS